MSASPDVPAEVSPDAGSADTPVPHPRSARRDATRGRLMDAAVEVFAEVGFGAASVELVAERAGFSRGAFYSNFASKEELLIAAVDRGMTGWIETVSRRVEELTAGRERLSDEPVALGGLVTEVLAGEASTRSWHLVQLEFRLLALRDPAVAAAQRALDARLADRTIALVDTGLAALRRRRLLDATGTVALLAGVYESVLNRVLLAGRPLDDVASEVREPMAAALLAISAEV